MLFSVAFFLKILIYYNDAEGKGSREADAHQGSSQCCIVGKVIGPVRFLAEDIRKSQPPPVLGSFQKTLIFCTEDSLNLTGNVDCTLINFILR